MRKFFLLILCGIFIWASSLSAETPTSNDTENEIKAYRLDIVVDAPASFLYPYLIYEDKVSRWNKDESVEVSFPRGIEPRIGKQIHVSMKVPTHPWMLMEIIKLDTNREVVTRFVDGVLEGTFVYLLEPLGAERTRLVHVMRIRPVGPVVTVVWEVYGKRMHREKMKNFLKNIKRVVEEDYRRQTAEE